MKLRILSDLHFEFHADGGRTFISCQNDPDYDVLILAGDINTAAGIQDTLINFRKSAGSRPIIMVPGNHEYYHSSVLETKRVLESCREQDNNLHILDNKLVTIDGVRFVGSTLWFPHSGLHERGDEDLNDFALIDGFRDWVGQQARKSSSFLDQTIESGDVVITHHLPHMGSIHPQYKESSLNRYFLHNVSPLVEDLGVRLWVHGHTHSSMDYKVGGTRVVCNPFGYLRYQENSKFVEKLTVQV